MTQALRSLEDADFGWVQSLESVWSNEGSPDAGPNEKFVDDLIRDVSRLTGTPEVPGRVFLGQAGIGKTHLVGVSRRRAWAHGCWFVMLDVIGIVDFWNSAALSFVTSLLQEMPNGKRQYEAVIAGIARRFRIEAEVDVAFDSPTIEARRVVDLLVGGLMRTDMGNALRHRDVFRALALLRSQDIATVGVAHAWLQGFDADPTMRQSLGFISGPPAPVQIVQGLLWVMSLAGPTLIAVDQIDGIITRKPLNPIVEIGDGADFTSLLIGGLLQLVRMTGRGMLAVTCLPASWEIIGDEGAAPFVQSFAAPSVLRLADNADFVRRLIADRLAPAFTKHAIKPESNVWPFTDRAIASAATGMTPRTILMRCDEHRRRCLADGKVGVCDDLAGSDAPLPPPTPPPGLDAAYAATIVAADLAGLLDNRNDGPLGSLIREALDLYVKQIPPHHDYDVGSESDPIQRTPPLHGRVVFTDHRSNDRQRHFCFRALQHGNATALCTRFRAALTASGITAGVESRRLVIVRRGPPPNGPTVAGLFSAFAKAGGTVVDPSDEDLRRFVAIREMRDAALAESRFDAFERWLIERKPLCDTAFFKTAGLCPPPIPHGHENPTEPAPVVGDAPDGAPHHEDVGEAAPQTQRKVRDAPGNPTPAIPRPPTEPTVIPIGHRLAGGEPVDLPTSILPRHTAIIAGAGSGKTVLLRRIVEEAALAGIPAIVIDPNNDLSRLGDAWPERPAGFDDEDAAKARRYAATVEVVVWTPGVHGGNPLFLSVLPDFASLGDDPDERAQAVTMAADTLGPLAGAKTNLAKGVLADALRHFATKSGGTLKDMTALLADLPEGVSEIGNAEKLAAKMADELKAAVATNPLLKATGPVLDPKLLFFGPDATRTRISVINLSGLVSDDAKEDFVNRLQMTLFGWIKKHPSPRGMLYVIDEAQTFIPSGASALSKTSGVTLVAQARKYGLGMIVVTQAPKGIDNKVVSNCTTQFLGKQNSPTDQGTVKQMIAATGGDADDIGKLKRAEFYFKSEGTGKPTKLRTPLCLSWHPPNPPTPEEVVARARASKP